MIEGLPLAAGIFLSNWLIVPLLFERTFTEGFGIGVIAALLALGFYAVT